MSETTEAGLARRLGLMGLVATGVCSMIGAAINVIPIMIQRNVPGIGPYVLPSYLLATLPAVLAAMAYAALGSGMPRAGGSYVYASRALNPYLGFVASFSQWFGISAAIGVVSYLLAPFLRDIATALDWTGVAAWLDTPSVRLALALAFLWTFAGVNLLGSKVYEKTLVPLMFLMFVGGLVVIAWGFHFDHGQFLDALTRREGGTAVLADSNANPGWSGFLAASAILFSTFIGFDSIAQAGGEAKEPGRNLPLSIGVCVFVVACYYLLFTAAIYHTVPWRFVAERAQHADLTAPGLLGFLLSPGWTVAILAGAAVALTNDLPAMILAVSRLMFAWAEDGIFPGSLAVVNRRWQTPHNAILASSAMASACVLGCHAASDFFLGVDVLIISMLVNFLLICLSLLFLQRLNPDLAGRLRFAKNRVSQVAIGAAGTLTLGVLLVSQIAKDLGTPQPNWYFHSTLVWILVTFGATLIFLWKWRQLRRVDPDLRRRFRDLPPG